MNKTLRTKGALRVRIVSNPTEEDLPITFTFPWDEDYAPVPDDPRETLHLDLWKPTVHSDPTIHLVDISNCVDKATQVAAVLNTSYGFKLQTSAPIYYVNEPGGTLNFKVEVQEYGMPLLLRIHKRIKNDDARLTLLHRLQNHVYNSHVFSDGLGDCLKPIETSLTHRDFAVFRGHYVSVSIFAEGVNHFTGASTGALASLAENFGALQKSLQEFDCSSVSIVGRAVSESWIRLDLPLFTLITSLAEQAHRNRVGRFADLFYAHIDYLRGLCCELRDVNIQTSIQPLLYDLHPHNTFFRDEKCVLIYDFEDVASGSDHSAALAFAIHRFVREYVIRSRNIRKQTIQGLVDLFLEHYQKGGMVIPRDFKESLHLHIKLVNLMKLLHVMAYFFRIEEDPAHRTEHDWYVGIRNFLMFLLEAQQFRPAN